MRIVIVEDEPKTRAGLLHILEQKTEYEVVGVAENGEEGYQLISQMQPDLVISDICMSKMSGLEMLQKMRDQNIDTHVILLTGHSDFEYARTALRLQVVEYVLKPIEVDKLLQILQSIEMKIQKRNSERLSPEQMLWSYASSAQELSEELCPALEKRLQMNSRTQSTIFLIRPSSTVSETIREMMCSTKEMMEVLCVDRAYIFQTPEERGFFLLVIDTAKQFNLIHLFENRVAGKLSELSDCVYGVAVMMGLGSFRQELATLRELIRHSFSLPENTLVSSEVAARISYKNVEYPDYLEQSMIRAIRSGNGDKITGKGEEFQRIVIESEAYPACIREYTMRFAAAILRVVSEIRGSYEKENETNYIMNAIAESQTKREVAYQLSKIISSAANVEQDFIITENGMVMNAVTFVRDHYDQDITLAEAARGCGVSQEHLSKVFSREVGVGFNAFVQNYRVSMAKRMLRNKNSKISEVAETVGYRDQKYFTKVFKKLSGITPAEYKREHGE